MPSDQQPPPVGDPQPGAPAPALQAPAADRCRATAGCQGLVVDGYCTVCGRIDVPEASRPSSHAGGADGPLDAGSRPSGASSPSRSSSASRAGGPSRASSPSAVGSASRAGSASRGSTSGRTGYGTTGSETTGWSGGTTQRSTSRRRSGSLPIELPFIPPVEPADAIMEQPVVPEHRRFCAGCSAPVGRSRNGAPGRVTGYCSKCRTPYSFVPALAPDDVLAGQYRVLGCLAYGGLGWIYLAQDERVSNRWVVLKGMLNAGDAGAMAAALAERQFLARVEHPNVVRIYNVVEHAGGVYIVMEYVGGMTLKTALRQRREEDLGPLPVELALAYVLAVLPAFSYLHGLGLVYNDFKPDNVMLQGDGVKLIDLGAVTHLDDPNPIVYGTRGYEAPEMESRGPSIATDLYSIARCLAVLILDLPTYQTTHRYRLPSPEHEPLFQRHESVFRFLMKATAHDPRDRYQSADEMAEALDALLREVTATSLGNARPAPSALFGGDVLAIRWSGGDAAPGADWRYLPAPRVAAADPAAGHVLDALLLPPARLLAALRETIAEGVIEPTLEVELATARALIELDRHGEAEALLARLETSNRREWRVNWCRGLSLLAESRPQDASLAFDLVYSELPGELAPRLALGLAAELSGDLETAARHYDVVSSTDPGFTTASFGLARVREAMGDITGAVGAYARIPRSSSLHAPAQLALARALIGGGGAPPALEALEHASAVIDSLQLSAERRAELAVDLLTAALGLLRSGAAAPSPDVRLLGHALHETQVRFALEQAYRDLAWVATGDEKIRLVDLANDIRPMTAV